MIESSSQRSWRKAIEVEVSNAVQRGTAHFHYAPQVDESFVIDLSSSQQFGVVPEVAQKPIQLPHRPGRAVETSGHEASGQMFGLEDHEVDLVIRFLLVPAILGPINPNQEKAIWDRVNDG